MHHCCPQISNYQLNFGGSVIGADKIVSLCCTESIPDVPAVPLCATGEETIQTFRRMREMALLECMLPGEGRTVTAGCLKCANYQPSEWEHKYLINYVNLSMYPSPCQCRCTYCCIARADLSAEAFQGEGVAEGYDRVFDALEYALGEGLIDPMAMWQISCGEITIHPFAERLFDLAKDRVANFLTNCFRFDPRIAANLAANPNSIMNLSIDAGTGGTWRKVKGFDNFGAVVENLGRYRESCSRPDQITLKYLIFPGMNDGPEDIEGLIGLMKRLQTPTLSLARDCRTKYEPGKEDTEALLAAAAHFVAALYRNGLTCDMLWFAPSERERVKSLAVDVLRGQAP